MAYFVGMFANVLPLPGGIGGVDGGMIGAFLAFGLNAPVVVVAVLVYRAFAFWLPTVPGAIAYVQLRRRVAGWAAGGRSSTPWGPPTHEARIHSNETAHHRTPEGPGMLAIRPNCECCDCDLPNGAPNARICTFECTFCAECVETRFGGRCPNCGGDFVRPPSDEAHPRPAASLAGLERSREEVARAVRRAGWGLSRRSCVPAAAVRRQKWYYRK